MQQGPRGDEWVRQPLLICNCGQRKQTASEHVQIFFLLAALVYLSVPGCRPAPCLPVQVQVWVHQGGPHHCHGQQAVQQCRQQVGAQFKCGVHRHLQCCRRLAGPGIRQCCGGVPSQGHSCWAPDACHPSSTGLRYSKRQSESHATLLCSWDLSGSIMDRALLHSDCVYKVRPKVEVAGCWVY
jgi:hypothetical protein